MNDAVVDEWISESGLTNEECAMIQPAYQYSYVSPAQGISSAILGGINLSWSTINGIQIAKGNKDQAVPIIGLVTGVAQIALAAKIFPRENQPIYYSNESLKTLCFINIGLGTTTMILSAWNLGTNWKPKATPNSWNIYGFPAGKNKAGLGLNFSHTF